MRVEERSAQLADFKTATELRIPAPSPSVSAQALPIPRLRLLGPALVGGLIIASFFGGFIGWAAVAPLSTAAIAPGKVKVESDRKTIQHLEGGIISRILVRDGQEVKAGQVLIELDETKPRTRLARLRGQLQANVTQLALLQEETATIKKLLKRGLTRKPKLLALQRRSAELEGDRRQVTAEINDAKDILERSKIKAPINGTIVELQVHTTGGVIKAGNSLMDIVPKGERLVIEAKVNPIDIDIVHGGLKAMVYLTPYNRRSLKPIKGRVMTVSADLVTNERKDQSYYLAEIELKENPGKAITGATLYPGMPVEVMILTGEQTMLQSLFRPILQSFNRSFRES